MTDTDFLPPSYEEESKTEDASTVTAVPRGEAKMSSVEVELCEAINKQDMTAIKLLTKDSSLDVNFCAKNGDSPLGLATELKNLDIMRCLLDSGAQGSVRGSVVPPPLVRAARTGWLDGVKLLLEHKCSPNAASPADGETGMHCSTLEVAISKLLLDAGYDINRRDKKGRTALWVAMQNGANWSTEARVKLLLERKADPNIPDIDGVTPLMIWSSQSWWCQQSFLEQQFARLLKAGVDVKAKDKRGRGIFAQGRLLHPRLVMLLHKTGADVNAVDPETGNTALHTVTQIETARALLRCGADPQEPLNKEGKRPMHFAPVDGGIRQLLVMAAKYGHSAVGSADAGLFAAVSNGDAKSIATALADGADVDAVDVSGDTALGMAVERKSAPLVEALLSAGAQGQVAQATAPPPLVRAARADWLDGVKLLLKHGCSPSAAALQGDATAMHHSSLDAAIARELLAAGYEVNRRDRRGRTALWVAMEGGSNWSAMDKIKMLLEHKADPNIADNEGVTPLMAWSSQSWWSQQSHIEDTFALLMKAGTDVKAVDKEGRGIFAQSRLMNPRVVVLLSKAGADVNAVDPKTGNTALHTVSQIEQARALLRCGADPTKPANKEGKTPLQQHAGDQDLHALLLQASKSGGVAPRDRALFDAVTAGDAKAVAAALADGADIDAVDVSGDTALGMAVERKSADLARPLLAAGAQGHVQRAVAPPPIVRAARADWVDGVKLLLEHKCSPNAASPADGRTAMHFGSLDAAMARALLAAGYDVDRRDKQGKTALYWAMEGGPNWSAQDKVKLLLERKADPNIPDNDGDYPLMKWASQSWWSQQGHLEDAFNLLLKAGLDVKVKDKRGRGIFAQGRLLHPRLVMLLHKAGADVNAVDPDTGNTALHTVTQESVARALLQCGAQVNVENKEGKTALSTQREEEPIKELLLQAGAIRADGSTLLHDAIKHGDRDLCRQHLRNGFPVDTQVGRLANSR